MKKYGDLIKLFLLYAAITFCLVAVMVLVSDLIIFKLANPLSIIKIAVAALCLIGAVALFVLIVRTDVRRIKKRRYDNNLIDNDKLINSSIKVAPGSLVNCSVWGEDRTLIVKSARRGVSGVLRDNLDSVLNSAEIAALRWFLECEPHNHITVRAATLDYIVSSSHNKLIPESSFELTDMEASEILICWEPAGDTVIALCGDCRKGGKRRICVAFKDLKLLSVGNLTEILMNG